VLPSRLIPLFNTPERQGLRIKILS
jgi:hypothetical protein